MYTFGSDHVQRIVTGRRRARHDSMTLRLRRKNVLVVMQNHHPGSRPNRLAFELLDLLDNLLEGSRHITKLAWESCGLKTT